MMIILLGNISSNGTDSGARQRPGSLRLPDLTTIAGDDYGTCTV
jgi:hypothetical protein